MVLNDLGKRVARALQSMSSNTIVDEAVINEMMGEICKALIEADVNIRQVATLRKSILKEVNDESSALGVNKRKVIQQAVFKGLIGLLDAGRAPFKPTSTIADTHTNKKRQKLWDHVKATLRVQSRRWW